jgi:hypothetical protein
MERPQPVAEAQQNVEFTRNVVMRLSQNEQQELERLNTLSNTLQKSAEGYRDPLKMSLGDLMKEWANKNMEAVVDFMNWISDLSKYSDYFDDIDNTKQWFSGIVTMVRDFFSIFWKQQRAIYVGVTLVFFAFFIYMIEVVDADVIRGGSAAISSVASVASGISSIETSGINGGRR